MRFNVAARKMKESNGSVAAVAFFAALQCSKKKKRRPHCAVAWQQEKKGDFATLQCGSKKKKGNFAKL